MAVSFVQKTKVLAMSALSLVATSGATLAQNWHSQWNNSGGSNGGQTQYAQVPEIDVNAGLLALAAVAAAMLLVWEVRRRRKHG